MECTLSCIIYRASPSSPWLNWSKWRKTGSRNPPWTRSFMARWVFLGGIISFYFYVYTCTVAEIFVHIIYIKWYDPPLGGPPLRWLELVSYWACVWVQLPTSPNLYNYLHTKLSWYQNYCMVFPHCMSLLCILPISSCVFWFQAQIKVMKTSFITMTAWSMSMFTMTVLTKTY